MAHEAVQAFMVQVEEQTACIEEWEASLGEQSTDDHRRAAAVVHNRLVEAAEEVAAEFNRALSEHRARQ